MPRVIRHVARAAAGSAIRPPFGMVPGPGGDQLVLDGCRQRLCFSEARAEIGDISKVIRLCDRHHIHDVTIEAVPCAIDTARIQLVGVPKSMFEC